MAITHREDSIKELSKRNTNPQELINNLGKQLSKEKLENIKKDQVIAELGKHQAKASLELMQTKNEVKALKQQVENLIAGGGN